MIRILFVQLKNNVLKINFLIKTSKLKCYFKWTTQWF